MNLTNVKHVNYNPKEINIIDGELLIIDPPGGVCTELELGRRRLRGWTRIGDLASGGLRSNFMLDIDERNWKTKRATKLLWRRRNV